MKILKQLLSWILRVPNGSDPSVPYVDPDPKRAAVFAASNLAEEKMAKLEGPITERLSAVTPLERLAFIALELDSQVSNGGFHQFFTNSRGQYDQWLPEIAELIPDERFTSVIQSAVAEYEKYDYEGQWENIGKSWEYFTDGYKDGRFRKLDQEYYSIKPDLLSVIGLLLLDNGEPLES